MESRQGRWQPFQTQVTMCHRTVMFILLLSAGTLSLTLGQPNPHLPYRWELRRFMDNKDGRIVLTFSGPLGGDPPHFIVSLCDLAPVDPCGHAPILLGVTESTCASRGIVLL